MNKKDNSSLKIYAQKLRKKGFSYKEIAKKISIAKSTVRFWCQNIPLNPADRKRLYTKQVLLLAKGPQSQKERRIREIAKIINEAEKEIQLPLSFETYRLIGAALYWAEGSKTKIFSITNSDPHLILFMIRWFEKIFNIPPQNLKATLNIYPQQNELKTKKFWSQLTGIQLKNFGKSFIKPLNKGYKKNNLYYGTIRIRAPRGTDMRHQVFAWIKTMLKDIKPQTDLVQKEWKSLEKISRPINMPKNKI